MRGSSRNSCVPESVLKALATTAETLQGAGYQVKTTVVQDEVSDGVSHYVTDNNSGCTACKKRDRDINMAKSVLRHNRSIVGRNNIVLFVNNKPVIAKNKDELIKKVRDI
mgnify:CR=1 FL=1